MAAPRSVPSQEGWCFLLCEQGLDRAGTRSGTQSGEGGQVGGEVEALVEEGEGDLGSGPIAFRGLAGGFGGGFAQAVASHRGAAVDEDDGAGQGAFLGGQPDRFEEGTSESECEKEDREAAQGEQEELLEPRPPRDTFGRFLEEHERAELDVLLRGASPQVQENRHRNSGRTEKVEREEETHSDVNPAML
jgi:hypothetical protein